MHQTDQPFAVLSSAGLGIPAGWDEDTLSGLFDFVSGAGKFSKLGPGLTSHPEIRSENQQAIHAAMLELERRGAVIRRIVGAAGEVTWMPNDEAKRTP